LHSVLNTGTVIVLKDEAKKKIVGCVGKMKNA